MITFKTKTDTAGEYVRSTFKPFNFPAGEAHTKITENLEVSKVEFAVLQFETGTIHDDLFQLAVWSNTLKKVSPETRRVAIMPYFPGARADRGDHTDIEAYVNFLKPLELDQLIVFDIHSQIGAELLSGSARSIRYVYPEDLFKETYAKTFLPTYEAVIAPDAGAALRAREVADVLGIPALTATKTRDPENGHLSDFVAPAGIDDDDDKKYLIVDDICDGGGTFMGLAEALGLYSTQLDLYVSHGVFSKRALQELPEYYGDIFTTNSYNPSRDLNMHIETLEENIFHRFDIVHLLESYIKY